MKTRIAILLLLILTASFAWGKDKRKDNSDVIAEQNGEVVSQETMWKGTSSTHYQVTNFILNNQGVHLTLVCLSSRANGCVALTAGQTYHAQFQDMEYKISAKPGGYNLVKAVEFKSRVVNFTLEKAGKQ